MNDVGTLGRATALARYENRIEGIKILHTSTRAPGARKLPFSQEIIVMIVSYCTRNVSTPRRKNIEILRWSSDGMELRKSFPVVS